MVGTCGVRRLFLRVIVGVVALGMSSVPHASRGAVVPGGLWISPPSQFTAYTSTLDFSAHAYPTNPGDPAIDHVNFTFTASSNPWAIACSVGAPTAGTTDVYGCAWQIPARVPNGPVTISFDVYDSAGNANLAPNGERQGTIQRPATSPSPLPIPSTPASPSPSGGGSTSPSASAPLSPSALYSPSPSGNGSISPSASSSISPSAEGAATLPPSPRSKASSSPAPTTRAPVPVSTPSSKPLLGPLEISPNTPFLTTAPVPTPSSNPSSLSAGTTTNQIKARKNAYANASTALTVVGIGLPVACYGMAFTPAAEASGPCLELTDVVGPVSDAASMYFDALANDPPDPDYKHLVRPVPFTLPRVHGGAGLTTQEVQTANDLIGNDQRVLEEAVAAQASMDRAAGAAQAGDRVWIRRQDLAVVSFSQQVGAALVDQPRLLAKLEGALKEAGFRVHVTPDEVRAFQGSVAKEGLPGAMDATLTSAGFSEATIEAIRRSVTAKEPYVAAGEFPERLADRALTASLRVSADSLRAGAGGKAGLLATFVAVLAGIIFVLFLGIRRRRSRRRSIEAGAAPQEAV